jgi:hypothetical protein
MNTKETQNPTHEFESEDKIRSQSSAYNSHTQMVNVIHEEYNSAYNHAEIIKRFGTGNAKDLNDEPKKDGMPVFIIGSGPSLDRIVPFLKDWEGGIVCTTSHALTFMYYGIEPSYIVSLDPFCQWDEIKGVDWSKTRTKLVTHPGAWPDLISNWPNEMLLYIQNLGRPDTFYATTQKHMFCKREGTRNKATFNLLIRTEVTQFACSPPCQLFIADRLGYGTAFLAGCDFAFLDGKERFTDYTVKTPERIVATGNSPSAMVPIEWEEHRHPFEMPKEQSNIDNKKIVKTKNGLFTHPIHLYYKKNMMSAWRLHCKTVYTCDKGAITEMPYADIEKVVKCQGKKFRIKKKNWNVLQADRYLASVGAFVLEGMDGGMTFIESENPEIDLNNFCVKANRKFACNQCGIQAIAEDTKDHTGEPCQRCKEGTLVKKHAVDVDVNMQRIRKLIAYVEEKK